MKKLREWSLRKKIVVGLLVVLGLGLVVPWPEKWVVQCPMDAPPEMGCDETYWVWREPLLVQLLYYLTDREVLLFKGGEFEMNVEDVKNELPTPDLIEEAFEKSEISEGERFLYLTYALSEYDSLPRQFQSNAVWSGTSTALDIYEAVSDAEVMCGFELEIQNELRRLMPYANTVSCE
jgi:hypothetical protein